VNKPDGLASSCSGSSPEPECVRPGEVLSNVLRLALKAGLDVAMSNHHQDWRVSRANRNRWQWQFGEWYTRTIGINDVHMRIPEPLLVGREEQNEAAPPTEAKP